LKDKANRLRGYARRHAAPGRHQPVNIRDTVYGFDVAPGQLVSLDLTSCQMSLVTDLDAGAGLIV